MEIISEKNKSGDGSLHDWFNKSKSSDGKKGWVQLGGKYAGKPCAKQPGQTTKPKCGSSKMKRDLNKDEEQAAFRRKNKKDPNPNRKGKAINVSTEETMLKHESYEINPAAHKAAQKKTKMRNLAIGNENPNEKAAAEKKAGGPKLVGEVTDAQLKSQEKSVFELEKKEANANRAKAMKKRNNEISEKHDTPKNVKKIAKELDKAVEMHKSQASRLRKAGISEASDKKGKGSGTKDACYHKVKSRYSVWPSAYASGALVKCRKKGAANWGNSSKKESYSWRDDFEFVQEGAAWTKKEGQNKEGGLNEKGRKSYERDNPGSDLKAPSKKVGNKRRASFCARMKGMRKRQKPSNNTGDDRLSKSLRAWNC